MIRTQDSRDNKIDKYYNLLKRTINSNLAYIRLSLTISFNVCWQKVTKIVLTPILLKQKANVFINTRLNGG